MNAGLYSTFPIWLTPPPFFFFLFSWNQLEVLLGAWQMITNVHQPLSFENSTIFWVPFIALPGPWQAVFSTCCHFSCLSEIFVKISVDFEVFKFKLKWNGRVGWEWNPVSAHELPPLSMQASHRWSRAGCGHCLRLTPCCWQGTSNIKYKVLFLSEMQKWRNMEKYVAYDQENICF